MNENDDTSCIALFVINRIDRRTKFNDVSPNFVTYGMKYWRYIGLSQVLDISQSGNCISVFKD